MLQETESIGSEEQLRNVIHERTKHLFKSDFLKDALDEDVYTDFLKDALDEDVYIAGEMRNQNSYKMLRYILATQR